MKDGLNIWLRNLLLFSGCIAFASHAQAQVRTKKPDRGTYQPPTLDSSKPDPKWGAPLVDAGVDDLVNQQNSHRQIKPVNIGVQQASYTTGLQAPSNGSLRAIPAASQESVVEQPIPVPQPTAVEPRIISEPQVIAEPVQLHGPDVSSMMPIADANCGCEACMGVCDAMGCDSIGCDSAGGGRGHSKTLALPGILDSTNWFGSVDLLLMFRRGDRPPALVTTGPSDDADTAGQLGEVGTVTVVGNRAILKDMTAGVRFEAGLWLDSHRMNSMVFRGWFAGEESTGFTGSNAQFGVLARPFLDVTDGQAAAQNAQLIVFPNATEGSVTVAGDSNVYGFDISLRKLTHGQYGGTIDLLYGYQYMRLDESLAISSTATSLSDNNGVVTAPLGAVISVRDSFETENEFHGGEIGFATMYRENCWSFRSLVKTGFGSLRRTAILSGQTTTTIDGVTASDNQGLLVRDTNSGRFSDDTFAWAPELDFTLGWHHFPNFDVTFGYHIYGLTDAIQPSGTMDRDVAVNLSDTDPITGDARPGLNMDFRTYYVQGLHFGMQYVY